MYSRAVRSSVATWTLSLLPISPVVHSAPQILPKRAELEYLTPTTRSSLLNPTATVSHCVNQTFQKRAAENSRKEKTAEKGSGVVFSPVLVCHLPRPSQRRQA